MAALQELAGDEQTSFPGDAGDAARDSLGGLAETQGRIIALLERVLPALNELGPVQEEQSEASVNELEILQSEIDGLRSELDTSRSEAVRLSEALDAQRQEAQQWQEKSRMALEAAHAAGAETERSVASSVTSRTEIELLGEEAAGLRTELQQAKDQIARLEAVLVEREEHLAALRLDGGRQLQEQRTLLEAELGQRDGQMEALRLAGQRAAALHAEEVAALEQRLATAHEASKALREKPGNAHPFLETEAKSAHEPLQAGSRGAGGWKLCSAILMVGLVVAVLVPVRDGRRQENAVVSPPVSTIGKEVGGELTAVLDALRQEVAHLDERSARRGEEVNEGMAALLARLDTFRSLQTEVQPREGASPQPRLQWVRVSLPFGPGADALSAEQVKEMDSVLKRILAVSPTAVLVVGYADALPLRGGLSKRYEDNTALSRARALSVVRVLIAGGVPESVVTTCAMGTTKPLAQTGTGQDAGLQRRVDILCW